MALIWNPLVRNLLLGRGLFVNMDATLAMTIYGGTQPSGANFLANWDTTYKNNQLVHFTGAQITHPNSGVASGTALVCSTLPAAASASNSGTAAWGIIWKSNATLVSLASATIPNTLFMVVPVSANGGNGIIQLDSTTVTSGVNRSVTACTIQASI